MTKPKTEIAHISTPKAHYTLDFGSGTLQVKPIITNADRIRAMTDEELAEWFTDKEIKAYERCGYKGNKERFEKQWLEWLKQEAK